MTKEYEALIKNIIDATVAEGGDGWSMIVCRNISEDDAITKIMELDERFDTHISSENGWHTVGHPNGDIRHQEAIFVITLEKFLSEPEIARQIEVGIIII